MHIFNNLLFGVAIVSFAAAAPDYCAGDISAFGYCSAASFVSTTTSSSPLISACQSRCFDINSDAGDWVANFSGTPLNHVDSIIGGPCGISLSRGNADPNEAFYLTNQDFFNLWHHVLTNFAVSGRASGKGTMVCQGQPVNWVVGT